MHCWFGGTVLKLLPIQIKFQQNSVLVSNCTFSHKSTWFWRILLFVSWLFIIDEIASHAFFGKKDKIATNIYQLYVLFSKPATLTFIYTFQTKAVEISHILNCLFR